MQLTSHATNQDLTSEIDFLCDTNSTSYPTADKVRRINASLEELVGDIIEADGTWEYDDTNYTTLPRGTGTLVQGQVEYSFESEYLQIMSVDILDKGNIYRRIKNIDHKELGGYSPEEHFGADSSGNILTGFPEYYDLLGDTIFLYPAPDSDNVTLASGIRVWFKRTVDLFTTSDTTQEPGLPSTHHVLLAYMAALPYNAVYHQDRVKWLERKIMEMRKTLVDHYTRRERDKVKFMSPEMTPWR